MIIDKINQVKHRSTPIRLDITSRDSRLAVVGSQRGRNALGGTEDEFATSVSATYVFNILEAPHDALVPTALQRSSFFFLRFEPFSKVKKTCALGGQKRDSAGGEDACEFLDPPISCELVEMREHGKSGDK